MAITDPSGKILAEVSAAGVVAPPASIGEEPSSWIGERIVTAAQGAPRFREFMAPLLESERVVAHVRVGLRDPGYAIAVRYAPLLASIALPVFLLVRACYFLLRHEIRPISAASVRIQNLLEKVPGARSAITQPAGLGDFVERLDSFVSEAQQRLEMAETEHAGTLASSRVLTYRKSRLEAVLDTLPDAALVLDADGVATFVSVKHEALIGLPRESILGNKPSDWCATPPLRALLECYEGDASRLQRTETVEFHCEQTARNLIASAHPLAVVAGQPESSGTLLLLRDTADERVAQGRQAEFISHVAHELKSPLHVLGMYGEMLAGKDGESEEFRIEASNIIRDEIERLGGLISTLMSIARIESGAVALDRQRVRLADFTRDALDVASRSPAAAGLQLDLSIAGELPAIYIDKPLFRVALDNLLTNALKYNRPGGAIELKVEDAERALEISVRDTGLGIALADQPHIFEKFYRSEDRESSARGGHGLGLTLAKQIVDLHAGEIRLESTPGEGTVFTIALAKTPALMQEKQ